MRGCDEGTRKRTSAGSIIGVDATRSVRVNPGEQAIKDRINKKAKRYRGLKAAGIPFVVAVCTDDPFIDSESFFSALFGRQQISFTVDGQSASPAAKPAGLDPTGLLTPTSTGAVATTVSEAWFVTRVGISGRLALAITRAANPWAANPIGWRPLRMAAIGHTHLKAVTRFSMPKRRYRMPLDT
jgi:hypothetical protein